MGVQQYTLRVQKVQTQQQEKNVRAARETIPSVRILLISQAQ